MSDAHLTAVQYLTPSLSSFWKWAKEVPVVVWNEKDQENTIAFGGEFHELFRRFSAERLPPFDLIVLLMAASRDNWLGEGRDVVTMVNSLANKPTATTLMWAAELVKRLHHVNELPRELRTRTEAKAELAAIVFERFPVRVRTASCDIVVSAFDENAYRPEPNDLGPDDWTGGPLTVALRAMCDGLDRVNAESLALRLRTGLDSVPTQLDLPLEEEEPEPSQPVQTVRELLDELTDDPELGGIVRLARNLMAVVSLPRAIVDHDDLPMGGVSDITNRGPLDRLLLSELAYDDHTLMTRVALNEALYLRRETPPAEPPRQRVLLLDNGLRMWGVPRVYQTAVALSLAATTDAHNTETHAFRAEGNEVVPVELRTREGLIAHLEALQTEAHPGAALNRFTESFDSATADVVVITGADVLADTEFRRSLHESDLDAAYLASVSRDGRFELRMYSPRGEKPLKQALLDVDKLLEPPPRPATPLIDPGRSIEYPAILRVTPFPLRMSHPDRHPATWHVQDYGSLVLTYDGRLMKWDDGKRGAIQLTDTAPRGDLLWWDVSRSGELMRAAIGKQHTGKMWLLTLNLDDDAFSFASIELQHPYFLRIVEHGGVLFVIRQGGMVDVHSLADGSHLKTMTIPGYHTLRDGRFFSTHDAWWALSYDGLTAHLEEVPLVGITFDEILTVFDCEDADGPVALLKDGSFYFTHNQSSWLPKHLLPSIDSYHLSRTGRRVLLKSKTLRSGVMQFGGSTIDMQTREVLSMYHLSQADTPPEYRQLPMRSLRTRFLSIGILDNSTLVLTSRRGTQWKIEPRDSHNDENIRTELAGLSHKEMIRVGMEHAGRQALSKQLKLVMIDGAESAKVRSQRSFEQMRSPGGVGFRLHQAVWEDGSRAILDSRGLLHLKSSDRSIPEVTLVLSETEVAVWGSDGRMCGSPYYLGEHPSTDLHDIIKTVITPFFGRIT